MGAALIDDGIHAPESWYYRLGFTRGEVDSLVAELPFEVQSAVRTDNRLIYNPILLFNVLISLAAVAVLAKGLEVVHGGLAAARDGDDMVDV